MKKALVVLSIVIIGLAGFITKSIQNGDWNNTTTWDSSTVPPDVAGDSICIDALDIVSISTNTTYTNPIIIIVKGILFLNSSTLTLPAGSQIIIEPGGMIDSNNNGAGRLVIGPQSWGGIKNSPITGPTTLDDGIPLDLQIDTNLIIPLYTPDAILFYPNPVHDKLYLNIHKEDIEYLYFYTEDGKTIEYNAFQLNDYLVEVDFVTETTGKALFIIKTNTLDKSGSLIIE